MKDKLFEKSFVINLPFRKDRLMKFMRQVPDVMGEITVWPAVHGDTVRPPKCWTAGNGAWGCYRSHMQILEHCIANRVESYVVFEDDAIFMDNFTDELNNLCENLPIDWSQLYLGGQLLEEIRHPPIRVNGFTFIPHNVNRTHAFAVHSRGYQALYDHLCPLPFHDKDHIDHHLGRLHESGTFAVYCPRRWMVGQDEGSSNISGKKNGVQFWTNPEDCSADHWLFNQPVCVFLEAPIDVASQLQMKGWHQGNWLNDDGLDRGVCEAAGHYYPEIRLREWYYWIQREVVRDKLKIPCLFHPSLTWEKVSKFQFAKWIHIQASTVDEALQSLSSQQLSQASSLSIGA